MKLNTYMILFFKIIKQYIMIIIIVLVCIINLKSSKNNDTDNEIKPEQEYIYVDIKGSVKTPGVYKMKKDIRVDDVVKSAGGFDHANTTCVNLAKKVKDEEVIVIPNEKSKCEDTNVSNSNENEIDTQETHKININKAQQSELEEIPGIGPKKAEAIIEYRNTNGSFKSIDEIKNIEGIGESTFENLKDIITV